MESLIKELFKNRSVQWIFIVNRVISYNRILNKSVYSQLVAL